MKTNLDTETLMSNILSNLEKFENPADFMEVDDADLKAKLMPEWKLAVAKELELQLTFLKFTTGQRFNELPAFERALRAATTYINNETTEEK